MVSISLVTCLCRAELNLQDSNYPNSGFEPVPYSGRKFLVQLGSDQRCLEAHNNEARICSYLIANTIPHTPVFNKCLEPPLFSVL